MHKKWRDQFNKYSFNKEMYRLAEATENKDLLSNQPGSTSANKIAPVES